MSNSTNKDDNYNDGDGDHTNAQPHRQTTHYQILGVDERASYPIIKAAHRSLALKYHPDKQRPNAASSSSSPSPPSSSSSDAGTTSSNNQSASKSSSVAMNNNDPRGTSATVVGEITYLKVQAAWECLRDQDTRQLYDDSLWRVRERRDASIGKAKVVSLSEMTCEYYDVEDDDDDDDDDDDGGGDTIAEGDTDGQVGRQKVYTVECRCGDLFEVLDEDVQSLLRRVENNGEEADSSEWDGMCECQSCSLTILVSVGSDW